MPHASTAPDVSTSPLSRHSPSSSPSMVGHSETEASPPEHLTMGPGAGAGVVPSSGSVGAMKSRRAPPSKPSSLQATVAVAGGMVAVEGQISAAAGKMVRAPKANVSAVSLLGTSSSAGMGHVKRLCVLTSWRVPRGWVGKALLLVAPVQVSDVECWLVTLVSASACTRGGTRLSGSQVEQGHCGSNDCCEHLHYHRPCGPELARMCEKQDARLGRVVNTMKWGTFDAPKCVTGPLNYQPTLN